MMRVSVALLAALLLHGVAAQDDDGDESTNCCNNGGSVSCCPPGENVLDASTGTCAADAELLEAAGEEKQGACSLGACGGAQGAGSVACEAFTANDAAETMEVREATAEEVADAEQNDPAPDADEAAEGTEHDAEALEDADGDSNVLPDDLADADFLGKPSVSYTLTFMYHRSPAWANLKKSEFRQPPKQIRGLPTVVPSVILKKHTKVVFHCPAKKRYRWCEAWVFFYFCPSWTCGRRYHGGIPKLLAYKGWKFSLCAPKFVTGAKSGTLHQMRAYRYKLKRGQSVGFVTRRHALFLAFALDPWALKCPYYKTKKWCRKAPYMKCEWNEHYGKCVDHSCRKKNAKGPPPPCRECPWKGLRKRRPKHGHGDSATPPS